MPAALRRFCRHEVDSGWAWVVCFASFFMQFVIFGTIQSFGTLFISLLQDFNSGESETAWVGSLGYGFLFVVGPVSTALCEHFGCRVIACVGSLLTAISLLVTSYSKSIFSMYFTFGVLWGIGASFLFFSGLLVLRFYFSRNISLANGITMTGAGFGTLVFNVMLQELDSKYSWRGGLRVLSVFAALTFLCGCSYLPPSAEHYSAAENWAQFERAGLWYKLKRLVDPRPWRDRAFLMWALSLSFILFAYFFPYTYLVKMAVSIDVPFAKGSLLLGYLSISAIFGKLLCGRLADLPRVRRLYIFVTSTIILSVSCMCVTAARSYDGLFAYALISGFFDGCFVVTVPLITQDIVGREQLANAIGSLYGVLAFPLTLGPPVIGEIYKSTGSFTFAFIFSSGMILVGVSVIYIVQKLRPELTARPAWPGPNTREVYDGNLIPGPSVHSMSVDALSGMCVTETGAPLPQLAHIEGNAYHRFHDPPQGDSTAPTLYAEHVNRQTGIAEFQDSVHVNSSANTAIEDPTQSPLNIQENTARPSSHTGSPLRSSVSLTEYAKDAEVCSSTSSQVVLDDNKDTVTLAASTSNLANGYTMQTIQEADMRDIERSVSDKQLNDTCQGDTQLVTLSSESQSLKSLSFSCSGESHHNSQSDAPVGFEYHQIEFGKAEVELISLSFSSGAPIPETVATTVNLQSATSSESRGIDNSVKPLVSVTGAAEDEIPGQTLDLSHHDLLSTEGREAMDTKQEISEGENATVQSSDIVAETYLVKIPPPPANFRKSTVGLTETFPSTQFEVLVDMPQPLTGSQEMKNNDGSSTEKGPFPEMSVIDIASSSSEKISEQGGHLEGTIDTSKPLEIIRIPPPPGVPRTGQLVELESESYKKLEVDMIPKDETCTEASVVPESYGSSSSHGIVGEAMMFNQAYIDEDQNKEEILNVFPNDMELPSTFSVIRSHASRPKGRLHSAILDQLNVLSERLEAVAARQIQEEHEQGNADAKEQLAPFSPPNQRLSLTPLYSENPSVPMTPVRGRSEFGSTTAPTPLYTPSSDLHMTGPTPTQTPLSDRRTPAFTPAQSVSGILDPGLDPCQSTTSVATYSWSNVSENAPIETQGSTINEDGMASCRSSASKDAIPRRQSRSSSFSEDMQEFVLNDWSHLESREARACAESLTSKSSSRSNISISSNVKSTSDATFLTQPIDIIGLNASRSHGVEGIPSETFSSYQHLEQSTPYQYPNPSKKGLTGDFLPYRQGQMQSNTMKVPSDASRNPFQTFGEQDSQTIDGTNPYALTSSDLPTTDQDIVSTESRLMIQEVLSSCELEDAEDLEDSTSRSRQSPLAHRVTTSNRLDEKGVASQASAHIMNVKDAWTTFPQHEEGFIFDIDNDIESSEDQFPRSEISSKHTELELDDQETTDHAVDEKAIFPALHIFSEIDDQPSSRPKALIKIPPPPKLAQRRRAEWSGPVIIESGCLHPGQSDLEVTDLEVYSWNGNRKSSPNSNVHERSIASEMKHFSELHGPPQVLSDSSVLKSSKDVPHINGKLNAESVEACGLGPTKPPAPPNNGDMAMKEQLDTSIQECSSLKTSSNLLVHEDIAPLLLETEEELQYLNLRDLNDDSQVLRQSLSSTSSTDDSSASTDSSISENEMPYSKLQENGSASEQG